MSCRHVICFKGSIILRTTREFPKADNGVQVANTDNFGLCLARRIPKPHPLLRSVCWDPGLPLRQPPGGGAVGLLLVQVMALLLDLRRPSIGGPASSTQVALATIASLSQVPGVPTLVRRAK